MQTHTQEAEPASEPSPLLWLHLQDPLLGPSGKCYELQGVAMWSSGGGPPVRAKVPAEAAAVSSSLNPWSGRRVWAGGLWAGKSKVLEAGGGSLCKGAQIQGQLLACRQGA